MAISRLGAGNLETILTKLKALLDKYLLADDLPINIVENTDSGNKVPLRSLDSGMYILKGYFTAFEGSTASFTFASGMLVSIVKTSAVSYVQISYAKSNTLQYLEISDEDYTRQDFKGVNAESIANKVTDIGEYSDDDQYPSALAVYNAINSFAENVVSTHNAATDSHADIRQLIEKQSEAIADLEKVMTVTSDELAAMSQEELVEKYGQGVRLLVVGEGENLVPTAISPSGVVLNGCGYLANYRLNSSGEIIESDRAVVTGFIPFEYGKTIEITGGLNTADNGGQYIATYDSAFNLLYVNYLASLVRDSGSEICGVDNIRAYTINTSAFANSTNINGFQNAAYIRISLNPGIGSKLQVRYV